MCVCVEEKHGQCIKRTYQIAPRFEGYPGVLRDWAARELAARRAVCELP